MSRTARAHQENGEACVQMTAWGSLAREVPRRNLRSLSLVSGEKVKRRASEACWRTARSVSEISATRTRRS